ncbi:hypothetical protein EYF80_010192 [Liparis tanakae]|uniref:Uncharacterized protein n=1 Tax=Liparis tanakae TaxID=230148 RepID=A0A4Z2INH3_9TELE|nr:hypothetical protein EYF80_010192 [Liparis tanakae]
MEWDDPVHISLHHERAEGTGGLTLPSRDMDYDSLTTACTLRQRAGALDGLLLCLLAEDGLGVLELGSAGPQVAGQQDVSVELVVQVVGAQPAAVGHWDAAVATAGVQGGAHFAACSITFHTAMHRVHRAQRLSHLSADPIPLDWEETARHHPSLRDSIPGLKCSSSPSDTSLALAPFRSIVRRGVRRKRGGSSSRGNRVVWQREPRCPTDEECLNLKQEGAAKTLGNKCILTSKQKMEDVGSDPSSGQLHLKLVGGPADWPWLWRSAVKRFGSSSAL